MTKIGCFNSSAPLDDHGPGLFQSDGNCQQICLGFQKDVLALSEGNRCWCGDMFPAKNTKVDDSECDTGCSGTDKVKCQSLLSNPCLINTNMKKQAVERRSGLSTTRAIRSPILISSSIPPARPQPLRLQPLNKHPLLPAPQSSAQPSQLLLPRADQTQPALLLVWWLASLLSVPSSVVSFSSSGTRRGVRSRTNTATVPLSTTSSQEAKCTQATLP